MSVWRRIARLVHQSRIRLPAEPIRATELHPGDWVQIADVRWRVMARRFEADRVVFRLRPLRGSAVAILAAPRSSRVHWTLEDGGRELAVPPELLIVYPVV